MDFVERTDSVDVPKNSGLKGLLTLLSALLSEIPRVKEVVIRSTGKVDYTWYAPSEGDQPKLNVTFESLLPWAIVRNTPLKEETPPEPNMGVYSLFRACHRDRLYPICFVTGSDTKLWDWLLAIGVPMEPSDTFFGYPLLQDREVPDDVLILCASFARTTQISDTYRSYKITMEALSHDK